MSYLLEGDDLLKNAMKNDQGARRVTRQPKTLLVYFYLSLALVKSFKVIHLSWFMKKNLKFIYLSSRANGYLVFMCFLLSMNYVPIFLREYFSSFYKFLSNAVCVIPEKIGLVFSRMRALPQFCKLCKLHNEKEVALIQKRSSMSTHNHIKLTTNFLCHKIDNLFTLLTFNFIGYEQLLPIYFYIQGWSQLKIYVFYAGFYFIFIDGAVPRS